MPRTLPQGLERSGGTPEFTQDTVPDALRASHALAAGRWGLLHVLSGALVFVDEETSTESEIAAPAEWDILPERHHHVRIPKLVTFRIDFYRAPG